MTPYENGEKTIKTKASLEPGFVFTWKPDDWSKLQREFMSYLVIPKAVVSLFSGIWSLCYGGLLWAKQRQDWISYEERVALSSLGCFRRNKHYRGVLFLFSYLLNIFIETVPVINMYTAHWEPCSSAFMWSRSCKYLIKADYLQSFYLVHLVSVYHVF